MLRGSGDNTRRRRPGKRSRSTSLSKRILRGFKRKGRSVDDVAAHDRRFDSYRLFVFLGTNFLFFITSNLFK